MIVRVIPRFYSLYSRKLLHVFTNTDEESLVSRDNCVAQHDDSMFIIASCKTYILLIVERNNNDLMQKLDKFCRAYQLVGCIYTIFKNRIDENVITKNGVVLHIVERAELCDSINDTRRCRGSRVPMKG